MSQLTTKFRTSQRILIDNEIPAYITGIGVFIGNKIQLQVAYFHNGINQETWIDEFRVKEI